MGYRTKTQFFNSRVFKTQVFGANLTIAVCEVKLEFLVKLAKTKTWFPRTTLNQTIKKTLHNVPNICTA